MQRSGVNPGVCVRTSLHARVLSPMSWQSFVSSAPHCCARAASFCFTWSGCVAATAHASGGMSSTAPFSAAHSSESGSSCLQTSALHCAQLSAEPPRSALPAWQPRLLLSAAIIRRADVLITRFLLAGRRRCSSDEAPGKGTGESGTCRAHGSSCRHSRPRSPRVLRVIEGQRSGHDSCFVAAREPDGSRGVGATRPARYSRPKHFSWPPLK
jgi:hypothetical protein